MNRVRRCSCRATLILGGILVGCVASAADDLILIDGATAPCVIVAPRDGHPAERFAAEELSRYLSEMSGREISIVDVAPDEAAVVIAVGATGSARQAGIVPEARYAEDDRYVLTRQGRTLYVAGCGPRGTLFAAYDLLERLGCRWFAPGFRFYKELHETVPRRETVAVDGALDVRADPAFKFREEFPEHYWNDEPDDVVALVDWCAKNRINMLAVRLNEFSDAWYRVLEPECRKRGLLLAVEAHGYDRFLPRAEYFTRHPEWFGPVDGRHSDRFFDQFNVGNAEALEEFRKNLEHFVRAYPYLYSISAMPNDSPKWIDSDWQSGKPLDLLFKMYDLVAGTVHDVNPAMKVSVSTGVPYFGDSGETLYRSSHNNVVYHTAVLRRTLKSPWHDPQSDVNFPQYQTAAKATKSLVAEGRDVIWSSRYGPFRDISLPGLIFPEQMAAELRDLEAMGGSGINFHYAIIPAWIPYEAKHYLYARLAWDPQQDPLAVLEAYVHDRFPGSPEEMSAFYGALRSAMERYAHAGGGYSREEAHGRYPDDAFDRGFQDLTAAGEALDAAMAKNASDNEKQLIWLLKASLRHAQGKMEIDRLAQSGQMDDAKHKVAEHMDYLEAWSNRGIVYDSAFLRMALERRFDGPPEATPIKGDPVEDGRIHEFKDFGPDGRRLGRGPGGP